MANNNNQKVNNNTTEQVVGEQVQQTAGQPMQQAEPQVVVVPQQTVPVEQKQGFGGWLKQHWKGAVAAVTGVLAVGGSAIVAYKKGKAAGIMSVPMPPQQDDDYSLNPNVE